MIKIHRICLISLLVFSTVGCDQLTKLMAKDSLRLTGGGSYFGDLFRLQYAENPGAFLNLGAHLPEAMRFWIFSVGILIFLGGVAFYLIRTRATPLATLGLSLLLGGGIGNLIDRLTQGRVVDFLNVGIGSLRTGIFNVADMAITAGVVVLFFSQARAKKSVPSA